MEWRSWTDMGGDLKAGATPSLAASHRRDLSVVARLTNGRTGIINRSTAGWFAWGDLGFACRDQPAMTVQTGRMIIAARGTDDGLWIGGFQHWTSSGGSLSSGPSIAAWKLDANAEIFARGTDATLQWFSFRNYGAAVHNPSPGTQRISGTPAAIAPGPNGIHVIARRDGDSRLIHASWNYRNWTAWVNLGEVTTSSPSVVSRDPNSLEIYFADVAGALVRRRYTVGSGGQLVSAGPREVLAPVVLGDPAAASFGPWHVEVFHRQANGVLARVYAEGVRATDDVGVELLDDQLIDSPPSIWALAEDVVVCAARNVRDELVTITAQDGYWGSWQNHGGFLDSDPVIVTRFPSVFEVIARDNNQQLARWTRQGSQWSGPVSLPAPSSGWCLGQPRAFADWQGGMRIVTRVNFDHLNEAVIGTDGLFKRWTDLLGSPHTYQPELVQVNHNALPAPFPGMSPAVAMESGTWVVVPGTNGTLRGRLFSGNTWGPWRTFSTRATNVRRPIPVMHDFGPPYAFDSPHIESARQAGWIGRAPTGDIQQQRMVWVRLVGFNVVAIVLDSTAWTASPTVIELATDPTGTQYPEPFANTPGNPDMYVTHVFGRSLQGHLRWVALETPSPVPLNWQVLTSYRITGDVAPLAQWSSYENLHVLIAAAVTTGRSLLVGVGGVGPAPVRVRPTGTVIKFPRPPKPPRPLTPPRPRPIP